MNPKFLLLAGSMTGLFAVIIGAFGAHGLEHQLNSKALKVFHTGVEYQFYHTFALLMAGIASHWWSKTKLYQFAGLSFLFGITFFSGSLYLYALTGIKAIAIITPFGGLGFIIGWVLMVIGLLKTKL